MEEEPKIMFNKAEGGTAGLHYRVPNSRQWAFSREQMNPVGSQETEHAKGNTLFWCFKHWKPRQNAKMKIKMKPTHSLNFFHISIPARIGLAGV
jgi:hypothetical protein